MQPTADPPTPVLTGGDIEIRPGMVLPLPDDAAAGAARERLTANDLGVGAPTITALGMMAEAVVFIAGVQGSAYPRPLLSTRVVLLSGSHAGGVVAGPAPDPRNGVPLQHLAMTAGAGVVTLEWQPAAAAIELEDAITPEQMDLALQAGWAEAERAADEGIELLVLAAGGAGAAAAAVAVIAAVTGAEPPVLLTRVVTPAGLYDDNAWMTRCLALRDALHRVRQRDGDPTTVLSALGGADLAAATGLILGAASRRTPVMIDGPVGAAAALVANDFSPQSRSWVVLPDTGRNPAVRLAAEALQLRPWLDLCLDLGEGAASLAAVPMLQTALTLAGAGEPVETASLSRIDSTGSQVYVGVAKPVEPADGGDGVDSATMVDTAENAEVPGSDQEATTDTTDDAGDKPADEKAKPVKATAAKNAKNATSAKNAASAKNATSAKNKVKGPTRTATPPKTPPKPGARTATKAGKPPHKGAKNGATTPKAAGETGNAAPDPSAAANAAAAQDAATTVGPAETPAGQAAPPKVDSAVPEQAAPDPATGAERPALAAAQPADGA